MANNEDRAGWVQPSLNLNSLGVFMPPRPGLASATWPTANKAVFTPLRVNVQTVITQLAVYVGATSSGNLDIGIYTADGTKMVSSGSTAQSATINAWQLVDVTDTTLVPGVLYYLAVVMDNTTGTLFRGASGATTYMKWRGFAEMASAFPLPATATLATIVVDYYPVASAIVGGVI